MKQKITFIGTILVGALLAFGPQFLFRPCPTTEKVMKCFYSCKALIAIGLIVMLTGVLELLAKETESLRFLAVIGAAACILSFMVPTVLIGACMKPEMTCNVVTFPVTHALSAAGLVLQALSMVFSGKKR